MKILSLRVEQFRKFDQAVLVENFGDGLNLISGPNETGKSTLLLALRAALFERHGAKTQAVKDFSPHHVTGARPTITLTFEIDGERYLLEKSFLRRPAARLEASKGQRFEGTEAEAELKRLLRLNPSEKTTADKDSPAHFGVLLIPQTQSFRQPDLADSTRHSLEAAIAADITELGNQSEVDGILAEIDEMLFEFVSKRGEPKNRYKDIDTRLQEIAREIRGASDERDALRNQFAELEQAIAERRELAAANNGDDPAERLASLEAERTRAIQFQTLENHRLAAHQRCQTAEAKRVAHQGQLEERQRIAAEIEAIEKAAGDVRSRLAAIDEALKEREERLAAIGDELQTAGQKRRELEALGQRVERRNQIEATLKALATDVRLELDEQALDRVTLDGEVATATHDLRQVTEGLSIEIEGVGRIGIEPKIEPMREALAAKTTVDDEIANFMKALDLAESDPEAIETAWQAVAENVQNLEVSRAEREAGLVEERRHAAEAKAALNASAERRASLVQRLAEIDDAKGEGLENPAALDAEIKDARAAFEAADGAFQAAPRSNGPGATPERLDAEITDLRARIEERRLRMDKAGERVLALESAISVRAGLGLDEQIDQLERQRHLLAQERDAFALDHQALSLLQTTLSNAADKAKATFNAPLSARLAPYVQDLFPSATPVVTPDFSIEKIDRNGVEEPFPQLSDGTREQIAILARLAFADMLQEQGLPALVVLDDALAFSDSERLARMFAILEKAAKRMQIIILTCREDQFAGVEAIRPKITAAAERTSSAA